LNYIICNTNLENKSKYKLHFGLYNSQDKFKMHP